MPPNSKRARVDGMDTEGENTVNEPVKKLEIRSPGGLRVVFLM